MVSQSAVSFIILLSKEVRLCEFDYDKVRIFQSPLLIQRLISSHSKIDEKHMKTFFPVTQFDNILKQSFHHKALVKPGFHLQQTLRPRHKKQSDYVVEQSSFPLIALF